MSAALPLSSVVVFLRSAKTQAIPGSLGRALHASFFELLRQNDASLAERLHSEDDLKAFSLSPLHLKSKIDEDGDRFIEEGIGARWRICCLSEEIISALLRSLSAAKISNTGMEFGGAEFELRRFATTTQESVRWAATTTAEQLKARASRQREINIEFLSPTSFRRKGRQYLFPEPRLVFGSWLRRWNTLGAPPVDEDFLDRIAEDVFVARYELATALIPFDKYKIAGFRGSITYEASKSFTDDELRTLNTLADFSFFSGTGYKTTMGLGETRRRGA